MERIAKKPKRLANMLEKMPESSFRPSEKNKPSYDRLPLVAMLVLLAALLLLGANLRSPLTSLAPVIANISEDLQIGPAIAGLLTSIPVLCFGIFTPIAALLIGRVGVEASIFITLSGVAIGSIVRAMGGIEAAMAGTMIIGLSITIGNIACLMVIARDFRKNASVVNGLYSASLSVGTMITSALTMPLALIFGWRIAIASWAFWAVFAIFAWILAIHLKKRAKRSLRAEAARRLHDHAPRPISHASKPSARPRTIIVQEEGPVLKRPIVWMLAGCFAMHTFVYYALTAWLPTYLTHAIALSEVEAGYAASVFQILGLSGSFLIPVMAAKDRFSWPSLMIFISALWIMTPLGLVIAPTWWPLWSLFGGICCGGGFTVIFTLVIRIAHNVEDSRNISATVQGVGYIVASTSPFLTGFIHQATGDWRPAFLFASFMACLMMAISILLLRRVRALSKRARTTS